MKLENDQLGKPYMRSFRRVILAVTTVILILCCAIPPASQTVAGDRTLILTGGKIYPSPTAAPISNGVLLVQDGKIATVGKTGEIALPSAAEKIECTGLIITAGFQNSHVHFTEQKWDDAAHQPAAKLSQQLAEMLTSYGVTTAVDIGSYLQNTVALRSRIESGELAGPRILTAGAPLYPPDGIPFYLKDTLPPEILKLLDQPATPEQAVRVVQRNLANGADVIKLFTGSLQGHGEVKPMPVDIAKAAVAEAHRQNHLVFSHPSNIEGAQIAADAQVDVLAHTTSVAGAWSPALIAQMKEQKMSLIPTLKLWTYEAKKLGDSADDALAFAMRGAWNLRAYSNAGGQILFGTDVGYMTDYNPTDEYVLMSRAGLTPMQILASLTNAPAARFSESAIRGTIARGMDADLVVLAADPAQDAANFARVRYTIRHGKIIYRAESKPARN
jgi:imidazolonepropionase-like amidohydrolase